MTHLRLWLSLFGALLGNTVAQVIDLATGQPVEGDWVETGSVSASTSEWTPVTTTYTAYNDPVVFLSTPLDMVGTGVDGYAIQSRMRHLVLDNGVLTFDMKIVQPNDSYCSEEWWIPSDFPRPLSVTWLVIERGGYMIDNTQTVVGYGDVNGDVQNLNWDYTFGDVCHYPPEEGDNDYAPGAIVTLQTMNNEDAFLTPRSPAYWFKETSCTYSWKSGRFFLQGHDGIPTRVRKVLDTERMGYLLFDPNPHLIDCASSMTMEFNGFTPVSDTPIHPELSDTIDMSSSVFGVFASLVTYTGGDSFAIRTFFTEDNSQEAFIYLQEDYCEDEETFHFEEKVTLLVVSSSTSQCTDDGEPKVDFYSVRPTSFPTTSPTHPTPSPTRSPTHKPSRSSAPTTFDFGQESKKKKKNQDDDPDGTGLLLAIILPIVIVAVIAIVGVGARAYFVVGAAGATALADSDHSGNNLVFDS